MSRIRVYELAKEAGLTGKALADKLIDLGYNIKGHSSTLEEDVADEIRMKVLGTTKTEVVEKRISGKGRTTVIRRRSKTVRQETETPPPPSPEEKPAEVVVEEEQAIVEPAEEPSKKKVKARKKVSKTKAETVEKVVEAEETKSDKLAETIELPEVEEKELKPKKVAVETTEADQLDEEATTEPAVAEKPEVVEKEKKKKAAPQRRKGLAKVIKKSAIQIPVEEPAPKPAKAKQKGRPSVSVKVDTTKEDVPTTPAKAGKGKKKGKRFVQFSDEEVGRERGRKAAGPKRKGKRFVQIGDDDRMPRGGRRPSKKKEKIAAEPVAAETKAIKKRIKVYDTIAVGDLSHRMGVRANQLIAKLMGLGVMATVNQALDIDTATLVATDFGYEVEQGATEELNVLQLEEKEAGGEPLPRPPVVTVMGHVDHGKTSILDAIRKTDVATGEAGGITQHIGAYYVRSSVGDVVFLDTPGHAAFTEMRSRGAKVTDVVVLVVAADDGVMDQTKEAINHAQAASVPIVVAVNKIDKANSDPSRVQRELAELGLVPEDWGGETIYCETSAKQGTGINELLDNILLQAEVLELKSDPKRKARGRVVEAQLHKGRGAVATILIQEGTLSQGEPFVVGQHHGKVRSLINDKGEQVDKAGPAMPVEVQGLSGVPLAGDEFIVVTDEKMAKNVSTSRQLKARETELASITKISLDKLFEQMQEGEVKELKIILRSDVQGTLEAFGKAIEQLSTDAIKVRILHEGTGTITDSDVLLASASEAIIIGFNVRPSIKVKELAEKEKVDIRSYDVIYHALDDIKKAMTGMLEPTYVERVIGTAEVRDTFQVPKIGTIAGCYIIDGKVERNAKARILRDGVVVYTGDIGSLRRFKDDVKEVQSGYECGIGIENFNDIKVGDTIESFLMDEVAGVL